MFYFAKIYSLKMCIVFSKSSHRLLLFFFSHGKKICTCKYLQFTQMYIFSRLANQQKSEQSQEPSSLGIMGDNRSISWKPSDHTAFTLSSVFFSNKCYVKTCILFVLFFLSPKGIYSVKGKYKKNLLFRIKRLRLRKSLPRMLST